MRAALAVMMLLAAPAPTVTVDLKEWPVPFKGHPRDPFPDASGTIWFVGQEGHYLGRFDPKTEKFDKTALDDGAGPHNLVIDPAGHVWFSGNLKGYIGELDPASGKIKRYPMPNAEARDPHTLVFDRAGNLWFTVQFGNFVGRLQPKSGEVRLVALPTPGARPYGIVLDSKGRPFFNEFGTNKIGSLDPATMKLEEYTLPSPAARSRRIAITRDDAVWFVDYARGRLGRLDPATRQVSEHLLPEGEGSLPYAMALDDHDRLWAVETSPQPNVLVGFDPKAGAFFARAAFPSGAGTVRHMVFDRPTRQIWFGTDHETIGRARIP
jgi:virginiamycin B lyase